MGLSSHTFAFQEGTITYTSLGKKYRIESPNRRQIGWNSSSKAILGLSQQTPWSPSTGHEASLKKEKKKELICGGSAVSKNIYHVFSPVLDSMENSREEKIVSLQSSIPLFTEYLFIQALCWYINPIPQSTYHPRYEFTRNKTLPHETIREHQKNIIMWLSIECKCPSYSKKKKMDEGWKSQKFSKNGIYIEKGKRQGFSNQE